jgi:hydrogenase/urease accessory protein HupE
MSMTRPALAIAAALCAALPAAAHPGHGDGSLGSGVLHYLSEPSHTVALMAAIAVCVAIGLLGARRRTALRVALRDASRR